MGALRALYGGARGRSPTPLGEHDQARDRSRGTKTEPSCWTRAPPSCSVAASPPRTRPRRHPDCLADLVRQTETRLGRARSVGVGTPGAISPATGLAQQLEHGLAQRHGRSSRSGARSAARCASRTTPTASRCRRPPTAPAPAPVVFGVILGTGVGGGIVVDGTCLAGPNRIAGEWGHNPLPWPTRRERPGPPCYCGKRGCIETFLSGPGAERITRGDGRARRAEELARPRRDAARRDARALRRPARARARARHQLLDPDVIVLGGGLSNVARWYDRVPRLWSRWVFSDRSRPPAAQSPRRLERRARRGVARRDRVTIAAGLILSSSRPPPVVGGARTIGRRRARRREGGCMTRLVRSLVVFVLVAGLAGVAPRSAGASASSIARTRRRSIRSSSRTGSSGSTSSSASSTTSSGFPTPLPTAARGSS